MNPSNLTDTNNEELREQLKHLKVFQAATNLHEQSRPNSNNLERFQADWLRDLEQLITSRDQQIALAAGIKELEMLDAQREEKTGKSQLFDTEMKWYEVAINLIWNRKAELERELATLKAQEKS